MAAHDDLPGPSVTAAPTAGAVVDNLRQPNVLLDAVKQRRRGLVADMALYELTRRGEMCAWCGKRGLTASTRASRTIKNDYRDLPFVSQARALERRWSICAGPGESCCDDATKTLSIPEWVKPWLFHRR